VARIPVEGTIIGRGTLQAGPFTVLAQVQNCEAPGTEVEDVRAWGLDATVKTTRPGKIPEAGEVPLEIEYDPNDSGHQLLRAHTEVWWRITYADGRATPATTVWPGYVKKFKPGEMTDEGNVTASITIKVTGLPIHTQGSP
jgi:hypothetical protein